MLPILIAAQSTALYALGRVRSQIRARSRDGGEGERGQATAEYALVLLGVTAVALVLLAWATKTGRLTRLFDSVLDNILDKV